MSSKYITYIHLNALFIVFNKMVFGWHLLKSSHPIDLSIYKSYKVSYLGYFDQKQYPVTFMQNGPRGKCFVPSLLKDKPKG